MYRDILLPTDGTVLPQNAVQYGILLAKSVGAEAMGTTVTAAFPRAAGDAEMLTDILESVRTSHEEACEQKNPAQVKDVAATWC